MGEALQFPVQQRQGLAQRAGHEFRQAGVQAAPGDAGAIAGRDLAGAAARLPRQEVAHPLGRGAIVPAAREEGRALPLLLKAHARQRILAAEVLRQHVHQQRGIGVRAVAGVQAHAVDHHAARLARRGHHLPAGAHAEREHGPPAVQVHGQLVIRRAQRRMPRRRAVLGAVDPRLQVLDARADGEGLAGEARALPVQHLEGLPGAVAHGEDHGVRREGVRALRSLQFRAGDRAVLDFQPRQQGLEAHVAAQGDDLLPQRAHDGLQVIGAHVGLCLPEDRLRRARAAERLQHGPAARVPDAAVQLAVGERARAALAELHVALRVERPAVPERGHVLRPLLHGFAPLHDRGTKPRARQRQRREQPARPHAHHQAAPGGSCCRLSGIGSRRH